MSKLPFSVVIFNHDDEVTSECKYPSLNRAQHKFDSAVQSAPPAVGRIKLYEQIEVSRGFGLRPYEFNVLNEWYDNDRNNEPDVQTAGYIVHSARSLNRLPNSSRHNNKTFHETEDDAVRHARHLADKWKLGHEGLIVFKAIKHVQKVERAVTPTTKIRVLDV